MTTVAAANPVGNTGRPSRTVPPDGYAILAGRPDEMVAADGSIRPPWDRVAADFAELEPAGLAGRRREVDRLLRNEGATYTVYDDSSVRRRPWTLDPCPLVLEPAAWATLETAVAQRARLLDLVLADIYGPRLLVERGLIPPELVLGSPAFIRPSDGVSIPGSRQLFTTAVDIVRDVHGHLRAVGDRAQAPSGLGYALVNRSILSRVLPDLYLHAGVERHAGFFRSLRSGITAVAPDGVDEPRVVILTPGPHSETYFEHAYLAATLGYPLVEGRDLEVRNNRVWVRSLAGLDPVDVVIRRVDDAWCDPVELRADSLLGVPGLMEAARLGRVSVINPVGVAIIESPAITGLLHSLAPALLGEDLAIAGPATWWCGRSDDLSHVMAHLADLVVQPVHPTGRTRPVLTSTLTAGQLDSLRDRIRHQPASWVAQEYLVPSTTPTVGAAGTLEPRPAVLRTFLVADAGHGGTAGYGYTVLPGGLTRVGATPEATVVSSQGDGTSKDTWVASREPAYQQSTWLQSVDLDTTPHLEVPPVAPLPSRVAAQLFMMGRTAEHSELVIRLIRTVLARLDQPLGGGGTGGVGGAESLEVLVAALGTVSGFDPVSEPDDSEPRGSTLGGSTLGGIPLDRRAMALVLDPDIGGSMISSLTLLIDAAYSVREQLSADTWQLIGDIEEELVRLRSLRPSHLMALQSGLQRLLQALLALAGISAESMERDPVWLFLDAGRRLERAQSLVGLLRSLLVEPRSGVVEDLLLESLLKTSESLIVFRQRTRSTMHVTGALELLVYDARNPRSLIYQLDSLRRHLEELPGPSPGRRTNAEERLVLEAVGALHLTDAQRMAHIDALGARRHELDTVLGQVDGALGRLLDTLRRTYFSHERLSSLTARTPGARSGRP